MICSRVWAKRLAGGCGAFPPHALISNRRVEKVRHFPPGDRPSGLKPALGPAPATPQCMARCLRTKIGVAKRARVGST